MLSDCRPLKIYIWEDQGGSFQGLIGKDKEVRVGAMEELTIACAGVR